MRRGKQERPRPVVEKIDEIARSANISAERANGLRQSSHLNIHAPVHFEMIDRAAAVAAEHAGGVGVVDHHDGAVFFRNIAQAGQRADVAIHREHAVGDQQLLAGLIFHAGQLFFRVGDVFVAEDQNLSLSTSARHR